MEASSNYREISKFAAAGVNEVNEGREAFVSTAHSLPCHLITLATAPRLSPAIYHLSQADLRLLASSCRACVHKLRLSMNEFEGGWHTMNFVSVSSLLLFFFLAKNILNCCFDSHKAQNFMQINLLESKFRQSSKFDLFTRNTWSYYYLAKFSVCRDKLVLDRFFRRGQASDSISEFSNLNFRPKTRQLTNICFGKIKRKSFEVYN